MATNEILRFAETDTGTNLLTQAEYSADSQRPIGNQPGVARSKLVNKALRQASLIAAGLAEYIADNQANNITDALTPQNIADYLQAAIDSKFGLIYASVTRNVDVVLSPAAPLKHTWNNVEHDPDGLFNSGTNLFTVPKAGVWQVNAAIHMTPTSGTAGNFIHALVNGAVLTGASKTGMGLSFSGLTSMVLSANLKLNAGDNVGIYSFLGGASVTQNSFGDNDHNFFQISFLGDQ